MKANVELCCAALKDFVDTFYDFVDYLFLNPDSGILNPYSANMILHRGHTFATI